MSQNKPSVEPPNGGWGWCIVGALFLSMGLGFGNYSCSSILFQAIMIDLDLPIGQLTWIACGFQLGRSLGSLAMPVFATRFGYRAPCMGIWLASGISYASTSLLYTPIVIYICLGFFLGFASGNTSVLCPVLINRYFTTKTTIALSISQIGVSLSTLILAPVTQLLIDNYAWRGAVLILGGFILNAVVASSLFRPINLKTDNAEVQSLSFAPAKRVLKKPLFWAALIYLGAPIIASCFAIVFSVPFAKRNIGASGIHSALVLSVYSFAGIIGKLFFGAIGDKFRDKVVIISMISLFCSGTLLGAIWFVDIYSVLVILIGVYSFFTSPIHVLYFHLIGSVVEKNDFKWAMSFIMFITAMFLVGVLPLAGLLVDALSDVRIMFVISACLYYTSVLMHIPILLKAKTSTNNK
uniref:monocarboxylate transporter 13-like n=1 Tax=Ciona intestinalis TaxID=7719 RepID=UPI000EF46E01|nr:monocarboxylate transporter 13-like [Ciona intestinalis]|eukprot:XP_026693766.1 monocarboxylate transporter 13-like [Ciona intestinalis]